MVRLEGLIHGRYSATATKMNMRGNSDGGGHQQTLEMAATSMPTEVNCLKPWFVN